VAAKGASAALPRALALEWGRYHINVNAIAPGYFHTSMTDFAYEDERITKGMIKATPLGRIGELRDLGLAALFLASEGANFITGQTIVVDGGLSL
jgi:NAD(P)-dependent dehydrogenase (short-subunit alcohol dehydrogenase family)